MKNSPKPLKHITLNCKFGAETKIKICCYTTRLTHAIPHKKKNKYHFYEYSDIDLNEFPKKVNLLVAHNTLNLFSLLTQLKHANAVCYCFVLFYILLTLCFPPLYYEC